MRITTVDTDLARLLQRFFYERLIEQQHVSARTIASYRDTFRLLLTYAEQQCQRAASTLCLQDLDATLVLGFLTHLETQRHNAIRTRNARLAAIRAFLHYAALQEPSALATIQPVLAIPMKRFERPLIGFLAREEIEAILEAPDATCWSGRRDRLLLLLLYNTGARVSEVIAIRRSDLDLGHSTSVHLHGKGRKERAVPLWTRTAVQVRDWLRSQPSAEPSQPLLPNRFGRPMSRSGVTERLQRAVEAATLQCPSLRQRTVSPHVLRHTTAMHLLQSGVDLAVIALWLGHEDVATTHQYLEADLAMKERALATLQPPETTTPRYQPRADVLAFLDSL
jgi:site-specific recombinase XerD